MNRLVKSLRTKLGLGLVFMAGALLAALLLLWAAGSRNNEELVEQSSQALLDNALQDLRQRGEVMLDHLGETLPNRVYYLDFKGLQEALSPVLGRPDVRYVQVYDLEGKLIHDGTPVLTHFGAAMDDPLAEAVITASEPLLLWRDEYLDLSRPLMLGSERIGGIRIGLSRSAADRTAAREQSELSRELRARFDSQMRWLFAAFSALLLAASIAAWLVGRGLLRPIRELARAADRLEHGKFDEIEIRTKRKDELGTLIHSFNRMARAMRDHDRDIRRLAYQDPLTGLPNRLMFRELLDQSIAEQGESDRQLGLLFIDLDDFKRINDTLGHDAGDAVLEEFANRLQQHVGMTEDSLGQEKPIVARLGGDEFVALVSGEKIRQHCTTLARSVLDILAEPFELGNKSIFLSSSIGITLFPDDARSSRQLLKCGDLAMYQAKFEGKNGIAWYRDHLTATAEKNLHLEHELRRALEQGQLQVVYQPVVCMRTGQMIGAEALLRWEHAELGEIPPRQFVAVAESSTLINEVGRFVMMRACSDATGWQQQFPGLRVGVNVSARQLRRRDLLELVDQALRASGLPANCLTLELTESSLLHDRVLTNDTLARLREIGIPVWLDDFGTGFSGLSHLRQLQVRGVKIDRSFIADILEDADDLALTSAVIAMAHSIGMRVIAEGVENIEQWKLLCDRGCDLAQGFLLSPPRPALDIPGFRIDPALLECVENPAIDQ